MALPILSGRILPKISISEAHKLQELVRLTGHQKSQIRRCCNEPKGKQPEIDPCNPEETSNFFNCQVAIVTGGSSGIGYEITRNLLLHGARAVVIADIVEDRDNMCCLRKTFGDEKVVFHLANVSKKAQLEKVFTTTKSKYNNIDIVINNAGILADSEWQKTICVNMYGLTVGTYLGIIYMGTHNCAGFGGTIINISSLLGGFVPMYSSPVYSGSKAYVLGLTRSLGNSYYCCTNVRVMGMLPGFTVTCLSSPKIMAKKAGYKEYGNAGQLYEDCTKKLPKQNPEAVGKAVIQMLKEGKHGDLYTVEKCVTEKICFPDWRKTLLPQKPTKFVPRTKSPPPKGRSKPPPPCPPPPPPPSGPLPPVVPCPEPCPPPPPPPPPETCTSPPYIKCPPPPPPPPPPAPPCPPPPPPPPPKDKCDEQSEEKTEAVSVPPKEQPKCPPPVKPVCCKQRKKNPCDTKKKSCCKNKKDDPCCPKTNKSDPCECD